MSNVIYRPLDRAKNEIRLVTLIEENHGRLECMLSYTSLDTPQPYEALSYCWGDQTEPKEILLDNHSFLITANLRDALRAIFRSTDTRTMWVDAICINQEDVHERNQQVLRMREIYQAAFHVIIWLGLKSTNSDLAINLISKRRVPAGRQGGFHEIPEFSERATKKLNTDPSAWEALEDFFHRPWWSRVWIVQEYISARRATFMCGETKLTRSQIERSFAGWGYNPIGFEGAYHALIIRLRKMRYYRMKSCDDYHADESSEQALEEDLSTQSEIANSSNDYFGSAFSERKQSQGNLFEVLADFGDRQSTDNRDGIFALLWLVNSHKFSPDYLKSTLQVYLDVIRQDISATKTLDVLIHRYRTNGLPNFPPDSWHSWADRMFGKPQYFDHKADILSKLCASGWKRSQMEMESDSEALVLRGIIFDKVNWLSMAELVMKDDFFTTVYRNNETYCSSEDCFRIHPYLKYGDVVAAKLRDLEPPGLLGARPYPTGESQPSAYLRTLLSYPDFEYTYPEGISQSEGLDRVYLIWSGRDPLISMQDYRRMVYEQRVKNWLSKENLSHVEIKYSCRNLLLPNLRDGTLGLDYYFFNPIILHRRDKFCTTEKGYMALVPKDTQKDDLICLLFGGSVPFVLRPNQDGTYRMIGACYVHGIMHGEGMGNEDWVEENTQTFKITMHGEWL